MFRRQEKGTEIGVPIDCYLLISVGELSVRKSHKVVVGALQDLPDNYWYVIVGRGELKDELISIDHTRRLILLGYRKDIADLLYSSDLFVFHSLQEGLPVALMEAMAAGLPVVCSKIRGNIDLIEKVLVSPINSNEWKYGIETVIDVMRHSMEQKNIGVIEFFDLMVVKRRMLEVYRKEIDNAYK